MNIKKMQKEIYEHKLNRGFNTTDIEKEFCLLYGEVGEAYDAYRKKQNLDDCFEMFGLSINKNIKQKNEI